jgi:hypothetical protein
MTRGFVADVEQIVNVDIRRLLHGNDRFSALEVDSAKYQRSL